MNRKEFRVLFLVEENGMLLVTPGGRHTRLDPLESSLWQLRKAGIPESVLCRFVSTVRGIPLKDATVLVRKKLTQWVSSNLLDA